MKRIVTFLMSVMLTFFGTTSLAFVFTVNNHTGFIVQVNVEASGEHNAQKIRINGTMPFHFEGIKSSLCLTRMVVNGAPVKIISLTQSDWKRLSIVDEADLIHIDSSPYPVERGIKGICNDANFVLAVDTKTQEIVAVYVK